MDPNAYYEWVNTAYPLVDVMEMDDYITDSIAQYWLIAGCHHRNPVPLYTKAGYSVIRLDHFRVKFKSIHRA